MIDIIYFDGEVKTAKIEDLDKVKSHNLWIDICNITKNEAELIKNIFGLHPLTVEDFINKNTRIKVEEFDKYLFCVFYGIKNVNKSSLIELDFVLNDKIIISNHKNPLKSFEVLKSDKGRLGRVLSTGPDFMMHQLLDREVDNFMPALEEFETAIDNLEDKAITKTSSELLAEILAKKRMIAKLKKIALTQREKLSFIVKNKYRFISKKANPYFRDIYDHAILISDTLDNQREAIGNCFDVYMSTISNNMNQVMKVLSIIATIALPMGVISGIYGTNFASLPGSSHFLGFWVMIGFMILIVIVMLRVFKKLKWF